MIAFSLGPLTIYRYGIFYAISFLGLYGYLLWIANLKKISLYGAVRDRILSHLDTILFFCFLGVLIGGRVGAYAFMDISGYAEVNWWNIRKIREGGMAFVGGVFGVAFFLTLLWKKIWKESRSSLLQFGDIIASFLPVGIALGRYGNSLNQELIGRPISELPEVRTNIFVQTGFVRIYDAVDQIVRVDSNMLEVVFEGIFTLIVCQLAFRYLYTNKNNDKSPPICGRVLGVFLISYSVTRFPIEYLKRYTSASDYLFGLTVSQVFMIGFFLIGMMLVLRQNTVSGNKS